MNQLSEILDEKGHDVLRIEADASVFEAVNGWSRRTSRRCS